MNKNLVIFKIEGYDKYYPTIKNPNIMNVKPVDKPCPTQFL